jgi:CheY-like chemotaxis protein
METNAILIVEDTDCSASMLEMSLAALSRFEVWTAHDGAAAWAILESTRGASIRAVVTDLEMPILDGFELIRLIRASGTHAHLPLVVVSATTDPHAPDRAVQLGADAFFQKPWSPARLRNKLEHLIHAKEEGAQQGIVD